MASKNSKNRSISVNFVGREVYTSRLKARLEHFDVYLYTGIPGIGKTSLLRHLLRDTRAWNNKLRPLYFSLWPGETGTSFIARLEQAISGKSSSAPSDTIDPYSRLLSLLGEQPLALALDNVHQIGLDQLARLIRTISRKLSNGSRLLMASQVDPPLSAIELMEIVLERVGPLPGEAVEQLASRLGHKAVAIELGKAAQQGMVAGHPLTLLTALSLYPKDRLPLNDLMTKSARSPAAFTELIAPGLSALSPEQLRAFNTLASAALPIPVPMAGRLFGRAAIAGLLKTRLATTDEAGLLSIHSFAASSLGQPAQADQRLLTALAREFSRLSLKRLDPYPALKAAEIFRQVQDLDAAIDTLDGLWPMLGTPELMDPYQRELTILQRQLESDPRVAVLGLRARLQHVDPATIYAQLQVLARKSDPWIKRRALATMAIAAGRMGAADKVAQAWAQLLRATGRGQADHNLLTAALAVGEAALGAGKHAQALEVITRLHQLARGRQGGLPTADLARVRLLQARVLHAQHEVAEAISEAEGAARVFRSLGHNRDLFAAQSLLGELYRLRGSLPAAAEMYASMTRTAQRWGERRYYHEAAFNRIGFTIDLGDFAATDRELSAFKERQGSVLTANERRELARLELELAFKRGDYAATAVALRNAGQYWDRLGSSAEAQRMRLIEGFVELHQGNLAATREVVTWSTAAVLPGSDQLLAATGLELAAQLARWEGELQRCASLLDQAAARFERGERQAELVGVLLQRALLHAGGDDEAAAQAVLKRARTVATQTGVEGLRWRADVAAAEAALMARKLDEARRLLRQALPGLRARGDDGALLQGQLQQVWLSLLTADTATALKTATRVREAANAQGYQILVALLESLEGIARYSRRGAGAAKKVLGHEQLITFPYESALYSGRLQVILRGAEVHDQLLVDFASHIRTASARLPAAHLRRFIEIGEVLDLPPRDTYLLWDRGTVRLVGFSRWSSLPREQLWLDLEAGHIAANGQVAPASALGGPSVLTWLTRLLQAGKRGLPAKAAAPLFGHPKALADRLAKARSAVHAALGVGGRQPPIIERLAGGAFRVNPALGFTVSKRVDKLPSRHLEAAEAIVRVLHASKAQPAARLAKAAGVEAGLTAKLLRVLVEQGIASADQAQPPRFALRLPPAL